MELISCTNRYRLRLGGVRTLHGYRQGGRSGYANKPLLRKTFKIYQKSTTQKKIFEIDRENQDFKENDPLSKSCRDHLCRMLYQYYRDND
jgi:hypothetical protein